MKCEICGKEYRNLSSHIWQSHSIYSQEYYDKYLKKEGEGICTVCGKPTEFRGLGIGYGECCSIQCATKNPKRQEKIRETNLKKYGVPNPFLLPEVVEKAQKNSHTKEAIEKQWETKKHRYGINPLHTEETKAKAKKGIQRTIVARTASFEKRFADFEKENDCTRVSKLYKEYGQGWKKIKDDLDIISVGQYSFLKNYEIEKIIEYNLESRDTLARSNIEDEVLSFIYDIFSGEIQTNIRSIISPQELDIYIPEKKIAIEVDGIYWHSTNAGKDKNYHLNKTIECEKRGIRLIHITEWEWFNKQDICKSILASSLGVYKRKIDARKCEIEEVGLDQAIEFLEENNIKGGIPSSYRLGLFFENELVQLITIGKSRFKKGEYELLRMCSALHTQVVGGFSKLISHQPFDILFSYVDRGKFSGKGYMQSGFSFIDYTSPAYNYYKDNTKLNRVSVQKHKLPKLLGDNFSSEKTEVENMVGHGWLQVYDCGNIKVMYKKHKQ